MPPVLTMDPITAVGDHTVAATISLAGGITTMITDGTISTATTSALIIFMAAAFMVVVVAFMAAATVRDQLLLIRTSSSYSSSSSFSNSDISRTDVTNRRVITKI